MSPPVANQYVPPTRMEDIPAASLLRRRRSSEHDQQIISSWRSNCASTLGHIDEDHASPPSNPVIPHTSPPPPIGSERYRPWRSVPVHIPLSSHNALPLNDDVVFAPSSKSSSNSNSTEANRLFKDYPGSVAPNTSPLSTSRTRTSLSASAASFTSSAVSPVAAGASYSQAPISCYPSSSDLQYRCAGSFDIASSKGLQISNAGLNIDISDDRNQQQEVDVPDWDILKRSIDATTMRGVWE